MYLRLTSWQHCDMAKCGGSVQLIRLEWSVMLIDLAQQSLIIYQQGMDLPDIQVVVQWRALCNLMTLWQRLGRGARDRSYTATAIFLVEKEHFDEEREKKLERQHVRKAKKPNAPRPLQSITNKRIRTESSTSRRVAVDNVEGLSGSSDESETEESTSMAVTAPVREDENSNKRKTDIKISELRHHYSTTVSAPRKKKSDPLEPAMDDLINAQTRKLECRRIPIQAYLEMADVCMCRYQCQLVGVINGGHVHISFSSHRMLTRASVWMSTMW